LIFILFFYLDSYIKLSFKYKPLQKTDFRCPAQRRQDSAIHTSYSVDSGNNNEKLILPDRDRMHYEGEAANVGQVIKTGLRAFAEITPPAGLLREIKPWMEPLSRLQDD